MKALLAKRAESQIPLWTRPPGKSQSIHHLSEEFKALKKLHYPTFAPKRVLVDRKSVGKGTRVRLGVELGGLRIIEKSIQQYEQHSITKILEKLLPQQLQEYQLWAEHVARSFQRASSQVEGRNGYLAFIHKANRGLSEQRLKVLTVIHNFDTRSYDNKTPAERLFKREFPDLFEFVLQNVTPFPEPRRRRPQVPKTLTVRA